MYGTYVGMVQLTMESSIEEQREGNINRERGEEEEEEDDEDDEEDK